MDQYEIIIMSVLGGYVLAIWAWQMRAGLFSEGAFADAPLRAGQVTLMDMLFGLAMAMGGQFAGSGIALMLWRNWMPGSPIVAGDPVPPLFLLWVTFLAEAFTLPAIVLVTIRLKQSMEGGMKTFGFRYDQFSKRLTVAVRTIVFILPAAFFTLWIAAVVWRWMGGNPPAVGHDLLEAIKDAQDPMVRWSLIVLALGVAPVIEEFFFRGLVQTSLRNSGLLTGRWQVIVLASVLFTGIHISSVPLIGLPGLFVLALGLGYVYERTGAIWTSILLHMAFNCANVAAVLSGAVSSHQG